MTSRDESSALQPPDTPAYYELPEQQYYAMPFARSAYAARLHAVERITPAGSTVLDIGCNDGRIVKHLLATGRADRVIAVDIQDLIGEKPDNLEFICTDVTEFDLRGLDPVDVVLALNVVHHIVTRSRTAARDLINASLEMASLVLVDMGSFSEHGPWRWRRDFERYWRSDSEMWGDIFGRVPRRALLRYAAMSGGHRTMWLLDARA